MFEEVVGLSPTGSFLLYWILPGEGLTHKKVAIALAGHQLGSETIFTLTVKKSPGCCTLAEYFAVDEKLTTALHVLFLFFKSSWRELLKPAVNIPGTDRVFL